MEKRIILVGSAYPYRGGLAAYNERLARAFGDEGDNFTIETFTLQYPGFLFPGKTQFADWEAPKGIKITRSVNSVNPFNWIKIGRKIRKARPDILIIKYWLPFMGPCFGTIARIARKNKHTRVISILDNLIPHEKRIGDTLFSHYFVNSVDGFVAMSKSVLTDIDRFTTIKPRLFSPHPLFDNFGEMISKTEAIKTLGLNPEFSYMLFFGLIRRYKGLDLLLEAFADHRFRELPIKLIIAGEFYDDQEYYDAIIERENLRECICVYNTFIPNQEVARYFCAGDIIVQPYKHATQSGVTQIAYQFEKPMLVTNVGGLPEIVPHGKAGYVTEVDKKEIADALLDFYKNKKESTFVAHCRNEKQKYTWDKMTGTINQLNQMIIDVDTK